MRMGARLHHGQSQCSRAGYITAYCLRPTRKNKLQTGGPYISRKHRDARRLQRPQGNMTMSLAFLAPDLVKAAIEGRLPHSMGVVRLTDLPADWSRQHQM